MKMKAGPNLSLSTSALPQGVSRGGGCKGGTGALGSEQGVGKRGKVAEGGREGSLAVQAERGPPFPSSGLSFPIEKRGIRTPSSTHHLHPSPTPEITDGNILENLDHKNTRYGR